MCVYIYIYIYICKYVYMSRCKYVYGFPHGFTIIFHYISCLDICIYIYNNNLFTYIYLF